MKRKGKEKMVEKTKVQVLKDQLREAREEVIEIKLELHEAMVDIKLMEYFKEEVNDQLNQYDESLTNAKNLLKRTLPLRRVMKHTRKRKFWLQFEKKKLKSQVKELEDQMDMIESELKKRGLKIKVINEPEEMHPPTARDEVPKA